MKLRLTVEMDINKNEMRRAGATEETIVADLQTHLVKVKSGAFENIVYGDIVSVEKLSKKKTIPR